MGRSATEISMSSDLDVAPEAPCPVWAVAHDRIPSLCFIAVSTARRKTSSPQRSTRPAVKADGEPSVASVTDIDPKSLTRAAEMLCRHRPCYLPPPPMVTVKSSVPPTSDLRTGSGPIAEARVHGDLVRQSRQNSFLRGQSDALDSFCLPCRLLILYDALA
jgi:hypothetical protein